MRGGRDLGGTGGAATAVADRGPVLAGRASRMKPLEAPEALQPRRVAALRTLQERVDHLVMVVDTIIGGCSCAFARQAC